MIYKLLSVILFVLLLVLGGFHLYKDHQHKQQTTNLYNQITKLEGSVKEANNAMSAHAIEIDGLKSALSSALGDNKQLVQNIKDRDESIVALNQVVLQLKNKSYDIKDAKQSVVAVDGTTKVDNEVSVEANRQRVDFDKTQDSLRISGYTLTNPAFAHVDAQWTKGLNLTLVLVKDKNKQFKTYIDSKNSDIVPVDLKLDVDPSVFEHKWYERIGVMGQLAVGNGLLTGIGLGYDFTNNLGIFGNYINIIDGNKINSFYGATAIWHPFGDSK